ncbi:MAG: hypothetical protein ACRDXD_06010 [Acidimicrobiia bacterium]
MEMLVRAWVMAVFLAGCAAPPPPADRPATGVGPGLSVEEALASDSEEPVLVNGALFARAGEVRLCSAVAESFPPQCAGAWLIVEGLDLAQVPDLQTEGEVSWSESVQVLGRVEGDRLVVAPMSQGLTNLMLGWTTAVH